MQVVIEIAGTLTLIAVFVAGVYSLALWGAGKIAAVRGGSVLGKSKGGKP